MFGNVRNTGNKTTFHKNKFWINMHMKEKILWGVSWQGSLSGGGWY